MKEMLSDGVVDGNGSELRTRFLQRVAPLLAHAQEVGAVRDIEPDFDGFDEVSRRSHNRGPDAATITRIRGDKNRAFLMD